MAYHNIVMANHPTVFYIADYLYLNPHIRNPMMNRSMEAGTETRTEHDSLGEIQVPRDALYQAQTQRAVNNFSFSQRTLPEPLLHALVQIKHAAALSNVELGELSDDIARTISRVATQLENSFIENTFATDFAREFPVDVFQTGSGTSSNMNVNEVIATLASRSLQKTVHPNDHVNRSQSSNDVFPSAIQLSAAYILRNELQPSLLQLITVLEKRSEELQNVIKTGRTHLMDAMPLSLGEELGGWIFQLKECQQRFEEVFPRLLQLPLGGTAIGTGINSHPQFAEQCCKHLQKISGLNVIPCANRFSRMSSQDVAVELSSHLKTLAVCLLKISNDLRWMNSGPLVGLSEIILPALQPGSSIMPGKVNPVIPEAVAMIAAQVIGNDSAITIAGQSGNFQLNVMLPLIGDRLHDSLQLLSRGMQALAEKTLADFTVNHEVLEKNLARNPILATALNGAIGYENAAKIAKKAYAEQRSIIDIAEEETDLSRAELEKLLDPEQLAFPHRK
jgi:fumarate hydratase class II